MDFIVVPTVRFRLLYAWFVIGHGRREIIHFGVTAHPTSPWVVQQLREAFPNDTSPRFLIYDNDSIFSERVTESIKNIGIEPRRTAFRSPWQNGIAERWVGSARQELLDHVIVLNERRTTASPRIRRVLQRRPSPHSPERFAHGSVNRAPTIFRGPNRWTAPSWRPTSSLRVARSSVIRLIRTASRQQRIRRMNKENPHPTDLWCFVKSIRKSFDRRSDAGRRTSGPRSLTRETSASSDPLALRNRSRPWLASPGVASTEP